MKKKKIQIESLKKSNIHRTPDGYFEDLPVRVMSKVEEQKPKTWFLEIPTFVRWPVAAIPAMAVLIFFIFNDNNELTNEELLASIETEDLIAYLESSDLSTDELIDFSQMNNLEMEFDHSDADLLDGIDFEGEGIEDILNDFDIENEIL
ncbi:MAG: hypothetical protein AAF363_08730 [Bacteroidota bacterium]